MDIFAKLECKQTDEYVRFAENDLNSFDGVDLEFNSLRAANLVRTSAQMFALHYEITYIRTIRTRKQSIPVSLKDEAFVPGIDSIMQ